MQLGRLVIGDCCGDCSDCLVYLHLRAMTRIDEMATQVKAHGMQVFCIVCYADAPYGATYVWRGSQWAMLSLMICG